LLQTAVSFADIGESLIEGTAIIAAREADQKVLISENNKRVAAAELKSSLERVPSFYQTETIKGDRKVIIRRIAAPAKLPVPKPELSADVTTSLDWSKWSEKRMIEPVMLQLHATVYDDACTKLVLTHEKKRYTAWTNLNFKYLQFLGRFDAGERRYSYFGVTDQIDPEREVMNARFAREKGFHYTSRWEVPPLRLAVEPEYVLITENDNHVPEEVYRQLDDLHGYYLANKEKLQIEYQNALQMQAARERYRKAHPEEPQDILLNYSRMSTPTE
jgi:hypothetical protein